MKALIAQIASQYVQDGGKGGLTPLFTGGQVGLGNFHPRHRGRHLMEHVGWSLIHHTEADMARLFAASSFADATMEVVWEAEAIDLFAVVTKQHVDDVESADEPRTNSKQFAMQPH